MGLLLRITILHAIFQQYVHCQVGVAFSPFARQDDTPGTASYTRNDIGVMLTLVAGKQYSLVTTYGVGAPLEEQYRENYSWKRCASVVHTAVASAEINREKNGLALSVYQGLYMDMGTSEQTLRTEIEVGLEVARMANQIFRGTVSGLVFPSQATFSELLSEKYLDRLTLVANRSHSMRIKFGARITDCFNVQFHKTDSLRLFQLLDFVICQKLPQESSFRQGPVTYGQDVIRGFENEKNVFKEIDPGLEVMLETGWPGGEDLGEPNTDIWNLLEFWKYIENWAHLEDNQIARKRSTRKVFLHEAFDNPWKRVIPSGNLAPHYGRWRRSQTASDNDDSKNAYELKDAKGPPASPSRRREGPSKDLIIGIVFGLVLFVALTAMIVLAYKRMSSRLKRSNKLSEEEIRQFLDGIIVSEKGTGDDPTPGENAWKGVPYNQDFELTKNRFSIDKSTLLGSGAFGSVYQGKITGLVNDVAFKTTRADCPVSALRNLLSEIKILTYLGKHENIVSICGAYTAELKSSGTVYVATELCTKGSLENYLRRNKSKPAENKSTVRYVAAPPGLNFADTEITDYQLVCWSREIASAMEYISSKNVIHADLATRNVLLTADLTAKVTDFGLSRHLYEYTEYVKKNQEPLPWRWMAIESLKQMEFSTKSDVWSYGITLWEIFSMGDIPYPGLTWSVEFVSRLENGSLRMQRPARASLSIYEVMTSCWHIEPGQRPTFKALTDALRGLEHYVSASAPPVYVNVDNNRNKDS